MLRRGLSREMVAGMVWMLLRFRGCMRPRDVAEALRRVGVDVGDGRVYDTLSQYNGILFHRLKKGYNVYYCAIERV